MLTKCTAWFSLTWSASWVHWIVQTFLISKLSVLHGSVLPDQQAGSVLPDMLTKCTAWFSLTWSASWVYCIVSSSLTAIFFHIAIHFISLSTLKFIKMTPVLNPRPWEKATSYQLIGVSVTADFRIIHASKILFTPKYHPKGHHDAQKNRFTNQILWINI